MGGGTPTRMRSNAVGGWNSYFMLGVGGCNYDASTILKISKNTISQKLGNYTPAPRYLNVLSSEIDPAEIRLIR